MRLVLPGLALIATSYGLARFAYGLFLPEMRDDVGLTPAFPGIVGGGSYLGYCIAIILSAFLVEQLGPRVVSISAGLVATLGMALIAVTESPWVLAFAVLFAGMSTGLASPPMADAVARVIPEEAQPRANTLINSGTSVRDPGHGREGGSGRLLGPCSAQVLRVLSGHRIAHRRGGACTPL